MLTMITSDEMFSLKAGAAALLILLSACGGSAASSSASPSSAAPSAAKTAASAPPSSAGPASKPAAPETVRAGYVTTSVYAVPPTIAKSAGFYEKHGINAQLSFIAPAAMTAALTAGTDADLGFGSVESAATVDVQGQDIIVIGALQQGGIFKISAMPPVKTMADLKGKSVAISSTGSTGDLLLRQLLQQNNLVPNQDVSLIIISDQTAMVGALKNGTIAAAVMTEPATSIAVSNGATVIYDQGNTSEKVANMTLLTKRSYLTAHRDLVKRFLMATMEGIHLIKTRPADAVPAASAFLKNDDRAVVQRALEGVARISDGEMTVPLESIAANLKTAAIAAPEVAKLKPEDVVDTSLLTEIKNSGFFDTLAKQ